MRESPSLLPTCSITKGSPKPRIRSLHFPQGGMTSHASLPLHETATIVLILDSPLVTIVPIAENSAHIPTVEVLASMQRPKNSDPSLVLKPAETPDMSECRFSSSHLVLASRVLSSSSSARRFTFQRHASSEDKRVSRLPIVSCARPCGTGPFRLCLEKLSRGVAHSSVQLSLKPKREYSTGYTMRPAKPATLVARGDEGRAPGVPSSTQSFSMGVCSAGPMEDAEGFVEGLLAEAGKAPMGLRELVVVASGCPQPTMAALRRGSDRDSRMRLFAEGVRHGKAEAINRILAAATGDFILLVNSDAVPEPGAISALLSMAASDPSIGAVSALPRPQGGDGPALLLATFMWNAHNESSLALNHLGVANHSSDELVVFRSAAIRPLPVGTVNDGAFMAATARQRGFTVKVCPAARVRVVAPRRFQEIVLQRRRILFGHAQVWRRVGSPPKTIESMLFLSPVTGVRLLVKSVADDPRFLAILPLAFFGETAAALLSIYDTVRSSTVHVVWRRFT